MRLWRGRPIGVAILTGLVGVQGLGFVGASYELAVASEWLAASLAAGVGVLLLHRAYTMWSFRRGAWLALVVLSATGAAVSAVELARGVGGAATWTSVVGPTLVALYLCHPAIRARFFHDRHRTPAG